MIGISLDIPEVAIRGGLSWLPTSGGTLPSFFADFTTEGTGAPHYFYNGLFFTSFSAWNTAIGGTFTRATAATFLSSGVVQTAISGAARFPKTAAGVPTGLRLTPAQTELAIQNRDLTNVAWTATTATVAKDQTGADGAATAASSILATAGNATVLQSITSAVNTRITGAYVKRLIGTGEIDITQDNGVTWTSITITGSYAFYTLPAASVTNPVIGFRIVTNGDKIAVDFVSQRVASFIPDVIATTTVSVTQNVETFFFPTAAWLSTAGGTLASTGAGTLGQSNQMITAFNNAGTYGAGQGFLFRVNPGANNASGGVGGNATAISVNGTATNAYRYSGVYNIGTNLQRIVDGTGLSNEATNGDFTGTNANRLQIGAINSSAQQQMIGDVKSLAYWPVASSVAQAAGLLAAMP